jgi:hypothetical protein
MGYDTPSPFTNGGPNDYDDPTASGYLPAARQVIDIAAPAQQISAPYYGGETGGNGPDVFGTVNGPPGGADWYSRSVQGTSFSAPLVAGGLALMYDAAYSLLADSPDARDGRVMKAVLLNAARKTAVWDNGQSVHPNGEGGVRTTQGLDNRVGAGRMDLDRAFDQLLSGTTDVTGTGQGHLGSVAASGWDFGRVAEGATNDYAIDVPLAAGSTFNATLSWFRDRRTVGLTGYTDDSYDNLDLEMWNIEAGLPLALVSESASLVNNTEHFSFSIPATGDYMLRVRWSGELFDQVGDVNAEDYGLAWFSSAIVPEPSSLPLALGCAAFGAGRRRRAAVERYRKTHAKDGIGRPYAA